MQTLKFVKQIFAFRALFIRARVTSNFRASNQMDVKFSPNNRDHHQTYMNMFFLFSNKLYFFVELCGMMWALNWYSLCFWLAIVPAVASNSKFYPSIVVGSRSLLRLVGAAVMVLVCNFYIVRLSKLYYYCKYTYNIPTNLYEDCSFYSIRMESTLPVCRQQL